MEILHRNLIPHGKSAFLWGPRKVGKTYQTKQNYQKTILLDMLGYSQNQTIDKFLRHLANCKRLYFIAAIFTDRR